MPTRAQLDRLERLARRIDLSHQSIALFNPATDDPAAMLAQMVADGRADPGRSVMFVPVQHSIEQWERETAAQQQQLIDAERERIQHPHAEQ
jgi:hypothetical protein